MWVYNPYAKEFPIQLIDPKGLEKPLGSLFLEVMINIFLLFCDLGAHDKAIDAAEAVFVYLVAAHHIEVLTAVLDGPFD